MDRQADISQQADQRVNRPSAGSPGDAVVTIEVLDRKAGPAGSLSALQNDIRSLGIGGVEALRQIHVYRLAGALPAGAADRLGRELLADPVTQLYRVLGEGSDSGGGWEGAGWLGTAPTGSAQAVEVAFNPGVMDPREDSIKRAAADLGIQLSGARTATRFEFAGNLPPEDLRQIAERLLINRTVQHAVLPGEPVRPPASDYQFQLVQVELSQASDAELERISREGHLWLTLEEMRAIQQHFRSLGRSPTDVELETLAQTWSEHCVHKTMKGDIQWEGTVIHNLLAFTIARVTEEVSPSWCLSVFQDNAGVIEFDAEHAICFKVETHNHPSALEPYGGASTGLGGVIRDVLGTGLSARPIFNTDVFCFGTPDLPYDRLPKGTIHPRRLFQQVRAGVADYGNRIGIPTVNGAVLFDDRYVGNPLVFCGTAGILPREHALPGKQDPGDLVVLVGGRTGRDGIHGATFSSGELTSESEAVSASSVQIGNPITEKRMLDALMQARDRGLFKRITDCGAGGISSACGEMGESTGVEIHLDRVPLKYCGLSYTEIWISEAQERMVVAAAPDRVQELLDLFAAEDVEATIIGSFTGDHRLRLFYDGNLVGDLEMEFLHHGLPRLEREATWTAPQAAAPDYERGEDLSSDLEAVLGSLNVCSKEWVIRQYDHEVQGGSVLKPLVGVNADGPGDAAVVRPLLNSMRGAAVGCGINPAYGDLDPYWMAASAIDEAIRQVVAVGASPDRIALLDNFSWGNTAKPDRLGALVRACQACYDIARAYGTPFISGKDSLNNEYQVDGETICIPHTLLISSLSVIPDVSMVVSMDAKAAGDLVYLVGLTAEEMGGSRFFEVRGVRGGQVPRVDPELGRQVFHGVHSAIHRGLVRACHDCSDGGLGVALAEMAFAGGLGMDIDLGQVPVAGLGSHDVQDEWLLFSESNSRFVVEVAPDNRQAFEEALAGAPFSVIGRVTADGAFRVTALDRRVLDRQPGYGEWRSRPESEPGTRPVARDDSSGAGPRRVIDTTIDALKRAWKAPLDW